jgi:hypothetical protein
MACTETARLPIPGPFRRPKRQSPKPAIRTYVAQISDTGNKFRSREDHAKAVSVKGRLRQRQPPQEPGARLSSVRPFQWRRRRRSRRRFRPILLSSSRKGQRSHDVRRPRDHSRRGPAKAPLHGRRGRGHGRRRGHGRARAGRADRGGTRSHVAQGQSPRDSEKGAGSPLDTANSG